MSIDYFESAHSELLTVRDFLRFSVSRFNAAALFFGHGSDNAYDEAAYLILHTLHLPLDRLEPFLDARITAPERLELVNVLRRRVEERIPAAYLTHQAWLGELPFYVDERTIVPRSFIAELLREELQPWLNEPENVGRVLDLCTGSGCLAIVAALTFPEAEVDAVDLSSDALDVAERNVDDYDLGDRLHLFQGDLYAPLGAQKYDLIISNPPYVDAPSMHELPGEYRHEPVLALAGGDDGLDLVHTILKEARRHLNPGGLLVVEIGHNREVLEAAYPDLPFVWLETHSGNEFVFLLREEELPA